MFPSKKTWLPCVLLLLATSSAWAQSAGSEKAASDGGFSLKQAFAAAWQRQPEAQSLSARQDAVDARQAVAKRWTAEPPALELSTEGDQLNGNDGMREHSLGLAIPLWLPGERQRLGAVADADARALASRALAAQLRTAAEVREAYWQWQRAAIEAGLSDERRTHARQLAADVLKRFNAGDLARSDRHQADSAVALAEIQLAQARSTQALAAQQLRNLTGLAPGAASSLAGEPLPAQLDHQATLDSRHPQLRALLDQAEQARRALELSQVQTRANPELTLATTRGREAGERYDDTLTLGLRLPFGSSSHNRARQATAQAEAIEAEAQARLARDRLLGELELARLQLESAASQAIAAQKRRQLAEQTRAFFDKSFRLGEIDLPTRLRVELEATDAQRQHALARLEQAASTSRLRQALGLLPE